MSTLDKVHVTMHAIERFMERIDPACTSYDEAKERIRGEVSIALRERCKLPGNAVAYVGDSARYIISEYGSERAVMTVLPLNHETIGCDPVIAEEVRRSMNVYLINDATKSKGGINKGKIDRSNAYKLHLEALIKERGIKISQLNSEVNELKQENKRLEKIIKRLEFQLRKGNSV